MFQNIRFNLKRILLQRSRGWPGKERRESNGCWVQGMGSLWQCGSEWAWKLSREVSQAREERPPEQMEAKAEKHPASSEDYLETRVTGGKSLGGSSSLMGGDKLACQVIFCLCPGHRVNDMIEDKLFRRECRNPDISPIPFPLSPQRLTATTPPPPKLISHKDLLLTNASVILP